MGKTFKILGIPFEVMEKERNFAMVSSMFNNKATELASDFRQEFESKFKDVKSALSGVSELAFKYIEIEIRYCIELLTKNNIYTYDEAAFLEKLQEYPLFESWTTTFTELTNNYVKITTEAELEKAYRELKKASRARMVGGGFGLTGAVKGMVIAGGVNVATGIMASTWNAIQNSSTDSRRNKALNKQFVGIADTFESELSVVLSNIGAVYMIILKEENVMDFRYPSEDQQSKYRALFNNLNQGRIPESNVPNVVNQLLEINPYDAELYEWILDNYGDKNHELANFTKYLYYDLSQTKEDLINYKIADDINAIAKNLLEHQNEDLLLEELKEMSSIIDNYYTFYGYDKHVYAEQILGETVKEIESDIKRVKERRVAVSELNNSQKADNVSYMNRIVEEYNKSLASASYKDSFELRAFINDSSDKFANIIYVMKEKLAIDLKEEIALFGVTIFRTSKTTQYTESDIEMGILITDKKLYILDSSEGKHNQVINIGKVNKINAVEHNNYTYNYNSYVINTENGSEECMCLDRTYISTMEDIARWMTTCLEFVNPKISQKRDDIQSFVDNIEGVCLKDIISRMDEVSNYSKSKEEAKELKDKMRQGYYRRLKLLLDQKGFTINSLNIPFSRYTKYVCWEDFSAYKKCFELARYSFNDNTIPLFGFCKDKDTYFIVCTDCLISKNMISDESIRFKNIKTYNISTGLFGSKIVIDDSFYGKEIPVPKSFDDKHMELILVLYNIVLSDDGKKIIES